MNTESENLKRIAHELEGAISAAELAFDRMVNGSKSVEKYMQLFEESIKKMRQLKHQLGMDCGKSDASSDASGEF